MHCDKCGTYNPDDNYYCDKCGKQLIHKIPKAIEPSFR